MGVLEGAASYKALVCRAPEEYHRQSSGCVSDALWLTVLSVVASTPVAAGEPDWVVTRTVLGTGVVGS